MKTKNVVYLIWTQETKLRILFRLHIEPHIMSEVYKLKSLRFFSGLKCSYSCWTRRFTTM